ncbi:uncharacterized protein LOC133175988 [Saccostrea echinata]|uniref:uncharacterized protein LOC133175988 n=1 Tax=Saccostrea echinata TaxID=191078 RepID=UPI002A82BF97|nr:uncharacterized protein LOC133175988 [Saccostrea echinata]
MEVVKQMPFARLVRQLNIHRKIIGGQCIMDFPDGYPPGVSVTDDWNLVILQLLKFIEVIGSVSNNPLPEDEATYLDFHEVFNNMYVFIGSLKLVVDQSFYMTEYLTKSLSVLSTLDYVGKTSYCISKKLRSRSIGKDVVQYSHQSIRVDPQTRQPLEFPSFWREKYRKYAAGLPFIMKKITRPQICVLDFLYRIQTCDIDDQNHTNNRAYVRLCMECSKRGAVERRYKCFSSVLFENGIKELQVRFENEALLGEEVIVYVWEATGRTDQLCFEIVKGLDVCIQATMTFYATPINYSTSGMNKSSSPKCKGAFLTKTFLSICLPVNISHFQLPQDH